METRDIQSRESGPDAMVPPAQAARALGVSIRTLHRWEKAGRIAVVRLPSGTRRYTQSEVDRILAGGVR